MLASENDKDIKKELWAASDKLRGNIDASEYKHVILGLVFLKYISDKFEIRYNELVKEGFDMQDDAEAYREKNIFYLPEESRFDYISSHARSDEIGAIIDEAMLKIEENNKKLKGILPKNYSRPELDKRRLGEIIDLFSNIKIANKNKKDILGNVYEYFLSQFATAEGKRGGEFYTPSPIVKLLVEILEPYKGRIYDPCCGSGGMFVQSAKFLEAHSESVNNISVYGQESNPTTWKLCNMNVAIHGIDGNLGKNNADTFFEDLHKNLKADYILANPPFNMSDWGADALKDDYRWKWGIPPNGNANYGWLSHIASKLSESGKAGVVLANGSLSTQTSGEGLIRQNMIKDDLIECIISLPTQLFISTQIPVSLWFLNKDKKQKGKVLFIDARNYGRMESRVQRVLDDDDIEAIAKTVHSWQKGKGYKDIKGYCKSASLEEISKEDYILTTGRYVGLEEEDNKEEDFDAKMKVLTEELGECFKESRKLEKIIKDNLEEIGYSIK
ncbi:type I restriction-modification system subunit M [Brachyspira hyodysenteriae]|uniref:type I restriction-modification system subunit M n=1 Tax=Brachyspira hyodysenteriae TaxID=159 RepID=UPI00063DC898|nr:class I SAM-dependent DNA methyltransferase [Brachyspira hyodysenteriae]KLI29950.1 N-6 DNA methylase [Brachyspira hyodysenteriae]